MKALSIRNPYAYLVAYGVKDVENRTWTTDYRGPLLIHCSGDSMTYPPVSALPGIMQDEVMSFEGQDLTDASIQVKRFYGLAQSCLSFLKLDVHHCLKHKDTFGNILKTRAAKAGNPMRAQSLIGVVDLVDVVRNAKSPFATPNHFHWCLSKPRVFGPQIAGVPGKLRLWEYDLTETNRLYTID